MSRFSISPIKVGDLSFLILDCPSDKSLPAYIPIFEEHNVTDLVRICEGSPYNTQPLTSIGIVVHDDMKFEDGTAPTKEIVARWLELNDEVFYESPTPDRCIAVHCVSGIGRAPVLVAISLVEAGMDPLDAIAYIRKVRRGALNRVQIAFLDSYKKRKKGFGSRKPSKSLHVNGSGYTKSNNALKQMPASSTSLASTGNSGGGPPPAPQPQQYRNGGVGVPAVAEKKKQGFISKLFGRK
ncbi:Protein tyrosine phosphatase type IVA 1 [Linnemannia gamsii]|uniref:protein-tyrosine-phosphatase n=1 Tax=Linnemannia gamsii TaxID=64522 RepID=A0A9P6R6Q2_9FUNG|nr:Protein tyrosine phosphatase type IVA 1 [Linnemannia gamsii]